MTKLFERIDVLERIDGREIVIYRCFRVHPSGGYVVQSADRIGLPIDHSIVGQHERQCWELALEIAPDERDDVFDTVELAVENFRNSF